MSCRRRRQRKSRGSPQALPVLEPNAAGIDVGATMVYAAVPADRDAESVRMFATFTAELQALADWLMACGIKTVAMESTGVYWIPVFSILEERGLQVCLVNARHVKHVPGRKSDVADCQWLQYLHAVGLLRGSFHPSKAVCAVRTLQRHRDTLVAQATVHVQHMQKALVQMNVQLHHVISDLSGLTGLRIVDAILAGERDPQRLALMRDPRIKASAETVAQALVGDWRDELLFTLRQALAAYRHAQKQIAECDEELARRLTQFDSRVDPQTQPLPADKKTRPKKRTSAPATLDVVSPTNVGVDLRTELYRICGVDLTAVPGIHALTAHTVFAELGSDLTAFPTDKHFASWLGLCPDNRVSGGKVLSVRTRAVNSRVALALRLAAQSLHHNNSALGHYYRRMRTRLGAPKAITATAHKLARIVYHLLTTRQPYDETVFAQHEQRHRQRQLQHLHRQALTLGYELVPKNQAAQAAH